MRLHRSVVGFGLGSVVPAMLVLASCISSESSDLSALLREAGNETAPSTTPPLLEDASGADASKPDGADAASPSDAQSEDATPPVYKLVTGHVEYGSSVANATVTILSPPGLPVMTSTTDQDGDFIFYAPLGASVVFKVVPPASATGALPMIRGIVVGNTNRIRVYYLAGTSEVQAAQSLGKAFDPTKGILEVDFRNASIGGYSAVVKRTSDNTTVVPGFGLALDDNGNPVLATATVAGGGGSTLLLADLPATTVAFTAQTPTDAGLPCTPCDAPALPLEPNVVTWFDYECGTATDCK